MAGNKSFVVVGVVVMVMSFVTMAEVYPTVPPCIPQSLSNCISALEGAAPNQYCCRQVRALSTVCLCTLYAEYGRGQNSGEVQRAKQIANYCDPQRGGLTCA